MSNTASRGGGSSGQESDRFSVLHPAEREARIHAEKAAEPYIDALGKTEKRIEDLQHRAEGLSNQVQTCCAICDPVLIVLLRDRPASSAVHSTGIQLPQAGSLRNIAVGTANLAVAKQAAVRHCLLPSWSHKTEHVIQKRKIFMKSHFYFDVFHYVSLWFDSGPSASSLKKLAEIQIQTDKH